MSTFPGREELYFRHQLSHQQIDDLLGEKRSGEFPESKAQHLGKLNAFIQVSELLFKNGISFIPQKGPILSYRLYVDPLYRVYSDLDFLIDSSEIPGAVRLLMNNGFRPSSYMYPDDVCHGELLLRHGNELCLWNSSLEVGIELHWTLINGKLPYQKKPALLILQNCEILRFQGRDYNVLNNELELLYLVIHGALHGWQRLKWLLDIKVFLEVQDLDEARFAALTRQLKAQRLVAVCNELLKTWFPGIKLLPSTYRAPAVMVRFAERQIRQPDHKKGIADFLGFFWNSWKSFPGVDYKIDQFKRLCFATDLASSRWMPCSALAYYIVSPFWKVLRGTRG